MGLERVVLRSRIFPSCSVEPAPPASLLGQGWAAAAQASLTKARKPSSGNRVCPSLGGLRRKVYEITIWTQVTLDSFRVGCPGNTDPFRRLGTLLNRVRPDTFTHFILLTLPSQQRASVFHYSVLLLYLEHESCGTLSLNAMGSSQSCLLTTVFCFLIFCCCFLPLHFNFIKPHFSSTVT